MTTNTDTQSKPCQGCSTPLTRPGNKGPWKTWCKTCLAARRARQGAESRERKQAAAEARTAELEARIAELEASR